MWSGQEDRQFIGRVWRQPQTKRVIAYRLMAMEMSEKYLGSINANKEVMHKNLVAPASAAMLNAEATVPALIREW